MLLEGIVDITIRYRLLHASIKYVPDANVYIRSKLVRAVLLTSASWELEGCPSDMNDTGGSEIV